MIERVEITIEYPEEMEGIVRLETLDCYDSNDDRLVNIPDLINNDEFHSEADLVRFVAKKLQVSADIIEIV